MPLETHQSKRNTHADTHTHITQWLTQTTHTHSHSHTETPIQAHSQYESSHPGGGLEVLAADREVAVAPDPTEGIHVDHRPALVLTEYIGSKANLRLHVNAVELRSSLDKRPVVRSGVCGRVKEHCSDVDWRKGMSTLFSPVKAISVVCDDDVGLQLQDVVKESL